MKHVGDYAIPRCIESRDAAWYQARVDDNQPFFSACSASGRLQDLVFEPMALDELPTIRFKVWEVTQRIEAKCCAPSRDVLKSAEVVRRQMIRDIESGRFPVHHDITIVVPCRESDGRISFLEFTFDTGSCCACEIGPEVQVEVGSRVYIST